MKKILLLEDDNSFGYILSEYLIMKSFEVEWVKTGEEAVKKINDKRYAIAILDIMLPGIDGFEVAKQIQNLHNPFPFIFLSAKSLKIDKLKGYNLGAYDYVTKPIDEEILVAKINALLDKINPIEKTKVVSIPIGSYHFDPSLQVLMIDNKDQKLTRRESELLHLLCVHKGRLLPRKLALREIWGSTDEFSRKSMDVFISHLRKYLSDDEKIKIENIHGKGFVLKVDVN